MKNQKKYIYIFGGCQVGGRVGGVGGLGWL